MLSESFLKFTFEIIRDNFLMTSSYKLAPGTGLKNTKTIIYKIHGLLQADPLYPTMWKNTNNIPINQMYNAYYHIHPILSQKVYNMTNNIFGHPFPACLKRNAVVLFIPEYERLICFIISPDCLSTTVILSTALE